MIVNSRRWVWSRQTFTPANKERYADADHDIEDATPAALPSISTQIKVINLREILG